MYAVVLSNSFVEASGLLCSGSGVGNKWTVSVIKQYSSEGLSLKKPWTLDIKILCILCSLKETAATVIATYSLSQTTVFYIPPTDRSISKVVDCSTGLIVSCMGSLINRPA